MKGLVFRRSMILLIATGLLVATSTVGYASLVRSFIYKPEPMPRRLDWKEVPVPEAISVRTDDGLAILGYRWPAVQADHITMVFFHGNAGNRYVAALAAAALRRPDVEIIVASYRGYAGNAGSPNEIGLYRDGEAFLRSARQSLPRKMYLFGYSLGGSVALRLAANHQVDGVITLGTFSSLDSVAPKVVRGLLPDHFDNLAVVGRLRAPLLLLHGTADEVIPFAEAEKLKAAAGKGARLIRIKGGRHHIMLADLSATIWQNIGEMPNVAASDTPIVERMRSADR